MWEWRIKKIGGRRIAKMTMMPPSCPLPTISMPFAIRP